MKRTLGNRHELGLILQADGKRAALAVDIGGLSAPEREFLGRIIAGANGEVNFGAHSLPDGRVRIEFVVGRARTVEDGVKLALVN